MTRKSATAAKPRPASGKGRRAAPAERAKPAAERGFPIVGVGASAGGLEAFTQLLKHLPANTGMAFVLVQHLDPSHESELTNLLARATPMPTREVTDKLRVEPNHVYVIPPNVTMAIARGVLKLEPRRDERRPLHSIDFFLESLAQDRHESAIGVILSGTATDGTLGLEAIKAEGGITFAQDDSARYDSMPRSAVAAGCVDAVLPPEGIAQELARLASHPYVMPGAANAKLDTAVESERRAVTGHQGDATPLPSGGHGTPATGAARARAEAAAGGHGARDEDFEAVLELLHAHCGVDFSLYKSNTIQRRIARRMVLSRKDTLADYATFLRANPAELDTLFSDVLICVTSFFRNPEAFDALKKLVFPSIARQRDEPMRAWVLGCSTGQEAYSIAMAYVEYCDEARRAPRLQVFATDLNEALLGKARAGLYARSVVNDVAPERLGRFFVEEDGGYRVAKSLREMVVFARQNLATDPPFSRMDLVSCRNLLIYLEPGLQQKALAMFHYALKPGGFLLLGASESVGSLANLFATVDKKHKIFSRKPGATPAYQRPEARAPSREAAHRMAVPRLVAPAPMSAATEAQREADRLMVGAFAPPGVLVNEALEVIQFRGTTSAFLTPPPGKASFDVLKMCREGLMLPLRAAINKAKKEGKPARRAGVRVGQDGQTRTVDVEVIPLRTQRERHFLILFERPKGAAPAGDAAGVIAPPATGRIAEAAGAKELRQRLAQSERALSESREYLASVQEQFESANDELQASSEELQSSNEELQSMNEELETSKEELESTNEELTTVNEELGSRNVELDRLNADLKNVLTSMRTAILVVDRDLAIRRFTPQAEKFFSLLATDVGRPLRAVRHSLVFEPGRAPAARRAGAQPVELEAFLQEVIEEAAPREREVRDELGRWYSLRAAPYLALDDRIDGAVLMLVDVDALKRSQGEAQSAREFAEATLRTMRDPLVVLDAGLRVFMANEAFYRTFMVPKGEVEGRSIYELGNAQWNTPRLRRLLEEILPRNSFFNDFEVKHDFPSIGPRTMMLNARRLDSPDNPGLILLAFEDVTERLESREAMRASEVRYRRLFEASHEGIVLLDPVNRRITDANSCAEQILGYGRQQLLGKELWQVGLLDSEPHSHATFRKLQKEGEFGIDEMELATPGGERKWVELAGTLYEEQGSDVIQFRIREVGERKRIQDALREAEKRMRFVLDAMPQKVFTATPNGEVDYVNREWTRYTGSMVDGLAGLVGGLRNVHPSDVESSRDAWRRSVETGEPLFTQQRLRRSDGEYRWHSSRAVAMKDASGAILMWVGSAADIHDIVEESRHKDEFMAMLAHELRNPLAPMRHVVEILRQAGGNEDIVRRARETLSRQVTHLTRLVDDLLDANRISRGVLDLHLEEVDLAGVIDHAAEACGPTISRGQHTLEVKLPQGRIWLRADPVRLAQVFGNLIDNAAKYSEPGGRISIEAELRGHEVLVSVRDTGIGIPPALLLKVFDMFTQVDRTSDRTHGGLGIGLALVKQLVEMHGGSVMAKSDGPGRGSEFVVRLPVLAKDSEASVADAAEVADGPARRRAAQD